MEDKQLEQALDQYAKSLVEKKGLGELAADRKETLVEGIKESLVDHINKEILRELPEDKLAEFEKFLDDKNKTIEDLGKIVESANLDMDALVKKVAKEYEKVFLEEEM